MGRRYPALDPDSIDLSQPLGPFNELMARKPLPWEWPKEVWKSGREKAPFGTANVSLSIYQARLRKLVGHSPICGGFIRTCHQDKWGEDRLLNAYARKQAARAAAKGKQCASP